MTKKAQLLYLVLLIPSFIESINHKIVTISIGPLTIGRIGFILVGILLLIQYPKEIKNSNIYKGIIIILVGNLIGALINNDIGAISRSIAFGLLLTGALGITILLDTTLGKNAIMLFFFSSFIYWVKYMIDMMFSGGNFNNYSNLYIEGEVINHHFVGMNVSIAGLFTSIYLFYRDNSMKLLGYFGIGIAAIMCFISESRSNTLITLIGLIILLFIQRKNILKQLFLLIPFLLISLYFINILLENNSSLTQRFDLNDVDYQERTTGSRFEMIEESIIQLFQNPLGKGMKNIYVKIGSRNLNIHNQYLTFIIGGGIIGLIGVVIWLKEIINNINYFFTKSAGKIKSYSFYLAIAISTLVFHITLLTLEFSSLLFFIIISLSILSEVKNKDMAKNTQLINKQL